jgi:hypothetical protein
VQKSTTNMYDPAPVNAQRDPGSPSILDLALAAAAADKAA